MSRQARWSLRLGSALAVALLALACLLVCFWIRGYVGGGVVVSWLGPSGFEASSYNGQLRVWLYRGFPASTPLRWADGNASLRYDFSPHHMYNGEVARGSERLFGLVGNHVGHTEYGHPANPHVSVLRVTWRHLVMPFPLPVLILAAFGAWWFLVPLRQARLRATRRRSGQCVECGYDLRHSPQRCPECGAPPEAN